MNKLMQTARVLSDIELIVLKALEKEMSEQEVAGKTGLPIDSVRRAFQWLKEKKLIVFSESMFSEYFLTSEGEKAIEKGLPEELIVSLLQKKKRLSLTKLFNSLNLSRQEFNAAIGTTRKNNWVLIQKKDGVPEAKLNSFKKPVTEKRVLLEAVKQKNLVFDALSEHQKKELRELVLRGLVREIEKKILRAVRTLKGEKVLGYAEKRKVREFNLTDKVPRIFAGRKQPYAVFLSKIKEKLVSMGFVEMEHSLIVHQFYNFDVLFQPQNHPARSWSDTYFLRRPKKGVLPDKKVVDAIKRVHENGGNTLSKGWNYKWSPELASLLMPVAHATAHTARQFVKGVSVPGKYFALSRCYRPDVIDKTHLLEFNQLDGAILDESISFKHLLGILKRFAVEIAGAKKVKFVPDYYPFVEPGVQLSAKHSKLGWVEFGGAGIGRPEILEPLNIKATAIMWGLGVDRLAMFKIGVKDIRELFSQNLDWLRNQPIMEDF